MRQSKASSRPNSEHPASESFPPSSLWGVVRPIVTHGSEGPAREKEQLGKTSPPDEHQKPGTKVLSSISRETHQRDATPNNMHTSNTLVSFPPSRIQFIFLVTPGMFMDLATLLPMSLLMRALLPTLGKPITATRTLRGFIPLRTRRSFTLEPALSAAFLIYWVLWM